MELSEWILWSLTCCVVGALAIVCLVAAARAKSKPDRTVLSLGLVGAVFCLACLVAMIVQVAR